MQDSVDANARMRENIESRTGKTFAAWIDIARKLGTADHADIVAYLKSAGPMSHGYANMIAHDARRPEVLAEEDPIDALFAGAKVNLRPIYAAITKTVGTFGHDIDIARKKTCVSLRRGKQFALLEPSTPTRLDIGLNLPGVAPAGRLEASGKWNGMVSHRVRIGSLDDFDLDVKRWLKQAYDLSV
jgi:hypothetical protein